MINRQDIDTLIVNYFVNDSVVSLNEFSYVLFILFRNNPS